jgi:para-nitrobenzyl esterase
MISVVGLSPGGTAGASEPVAETRYGKVRGIQQDGVYAFKGIRYGASTGGVNRFMPPRAPEPWPGVQVAAKFGNSAPQSNPNPPPPGTPAPVILAQLVPPPNSPRPERLPESEDCLFLNVWTAGLRDGRRRPVMLWLHGGFFYAGSGSTVDGTNLAKRGDVVVVSLNHRLNVLGFTYLAAAAGPEFAQSGNVGLLDILAASRWVQENIEAFGGDPSRVMVFGESGGGMKTSCLLAAPQGRGLLHRAAIQSGPGLRVMEREAAARVTESLLRELQVEPKRARELQSLPVERLLSAYFVVRSRDFPDGFFTDLRCFAPVVDGQVLPRHPFDPDPPDQAADIPLLIGWNQTEMTFFMGADAAGFSQDEASLRERAGRFLGAEGARGIELYQRRYPRSTASDLYIQMWSDFSIMRATLEQADRKVAQHAAPTFVYRFDWRTPVLGGKLKSPHTLENPFVWDDTERSAILTGGGEAAAVLAAKMSAAWVSFATSGKPDAPQGGWPHWPAYDPVHRPTMLIDTVSRVVNDPTHDERLFLEKISRSH